METSSTPLQFTGEAIARYLQLSFNDRELYEFLLRIDEAYECNGLHIVHKDGKITGVILGVVLEPNLFHICWMKSNDARSRKLLVQACAAAHSSRIVSAKRNGKLKFYNTNKLIRRFYGRA